MSLSVAVRCTILEVVTWAVIVGQTPPRVSSAAESHEVEQTITIRLPTLPKEAKPLEMVLIKAGTFTMGLNKMVQGTFRLPTEAEWEYACRADTTTRFYFGDALECDDGCGYCALMDKYMWWCGNNEPVGAKEVGRKLPNRWGLYDMHGNLWEWCSDWWQRAEPRGPQIDRRGPSSGSVRTIRAGRCPAPDRVGKETRQHRHAISPDTSEGC